MAHSTGMVIQEIFHYYSHVVLFQRGHWFPKRGDIESFRNKIRQACPVDAVEVWYKHIVISGIILYYIRVNDAVKFGKKDEEVQDGSLSTRYFKALLSISVGMFIF